MQISYSSDGGRSSISSSSLSLDGAPACARARRRGRGGRRRGAHSLATISSSSGAASARSLAPSQALTPLSFSPSSSLCCLLSFHTRRVLCVLSPAPARWPPPPPRTPAVGRSDGRCHRAAPSAAPWTHLPSSVDRRPTLGPSVLSRRPLCLSLSFPRWVSRLRPDRFPSLALASALPCMPPALMYPTAAATSALLLLRRLLSSSCSLSPLLK